MIVGASIGVCANKLGSEHSHKFLELNFDMICRFEKEKTMENLSSYFSQLKTLIASAERPIVIGGDHSCAIGTWAGIAQKYKEFGLIWVDAHMDSHTPETSLTQNVHGMPLANLLGYGAFTNLIEHKLKPENLVLVGIRSYEPEEKDLLERLGVKIFYSDDPKGLNAILKEAFSYFPDHLPLGMTIDMDAFDSKYAPGVNTPESDGIDLEEFIKSVNEYAKQPFCALEIVEFNPTLDIDNRTARSIERIVQCLSSNLSKEDF